MAVQVIRNDGSREKCAGLVASRCGADYVKIGQTFPANFDDVDVTAKCASFDGDADRLIYFRLVGLTSFLN
ncbi:hypothetical protein ANCDUO_06108 [Ancylostoma duodenale]|uniref:Phosphoacetylglucosamine mutase AMG1 domain-containing protein n=1 Tax=Ancylostoma duodenale TaxID=51022 RepID=A0A0C2D2J3_9BILA|nr:hypothetical protein ANCDUO_06108 [Ancylostoma duodenale]